MPVEISVDIGERPPVAIESTAYFVVAEALTNAAKHAAATPASACACGDSGDDSSSRSTTTEPAARRSRRAAGLEGPDDACGHASTGPSALSSPEGGPDREFGAELPCAS